MPKKSVADHRRTRLSDFVRQRYGGNKAALGRALRYADGAFVGQMLRGDRPITEKTVEQIHALPGGRGWFDADANETPPATPHDNSITEHLASLEIAIDALAPILRPAGRDALRRWAAGDASASDTASTLEALSVASNALAPKKSPNGQDGQHGRKVA